MTIGFQGPAYTGAPYPQPPGTSASISSYSESGVQFRDPNPYSSLALVGSGVSWGPSNGSAYLMVTEDASLRFRFDNLMLFNLVSMDLAEYNNLPGSVTVHVIGYKLQDELAGSVDLITDGINDGPGPLVDFQTFIFDSRFHDLYRVEITTDRFSLDNIVLSGVPEPSGGALLLLGAVFGLGWRRGKKKKLNH
jgi:hypothetical protein